MCSRKRFPAQKFKSSWLKFSLTSPSSKIQGWKNAWVPSFAISALCRLRLQWYAPWIFEWMCMPVCPYSTIYHKVIWSHRVIPWLIQKTDKTLHNPLQNPMSLCPLHFFALSVPLLPPPFWDVCPVPMIACVSGSPNGLGWALYVS